MYFPVIEGLTGQTLGKRIFGLRVTKDGWKDISVGEAFVRHLMDPIDFAFGGVVGLIVAKSSNRHQRIGDRIASTIVVEDKTVFCENCRTPLSLSRSEAQSGRFVCPKCGYENNSQLVDKLFTPLEA